MRKNFGQIKREYKARYRVLNIYWSPRIADAIDFVTFCEEHQKYNKIWNDLTKMQYHAQGPALHPQPHCLICQTAHVTTASNKKGNRLLCLDEVIGFLLCRSPLMLDMLGMCRLNSHSIDNLHHLYGSSRDKTECATCSTVSVDRFLVVQHAK